MKEWIKLFGNIKLMRNVSLFPFVDKMTDAQKKDLVQQVYTSLVEKEYVCFKIDNEAIAKEHDFYHIVFGIKPKENVVVFNVAHQNSGNNAYVILNDIDHIRIVSCVSHSDTFSNVYKFVCGIEDTIGKKMDYLADTKFGYLSPKLDQVGLGLQLSYVIHGIGIANHEDEDFFNKMLERGYFISRICYGEQRKSDLVKIASNRQFGLSEKELISQFSAGLDKFLDIESRQMLKYYNNNKNKIDDTILRSFGILKFCKNLEIIDGIFLLCDILTGLRVMTLKYSGQKSKTDTIGALMLRIMTGVFSPQLQTEEENNQMRAEIVHKYLEQVRES